MELKLNPETEGLVIVYACAPWKLKLPPPTELEKLLANGVGKVISLCWLLKSVQVVPVPG